MPSFEHEILVELFRRRGELAPLLLRACAAIELEHHEACRESIDLSQVAPTEYRADSVVRLYDANGQTTAAIVTEIQLRADEDKRFTWPEYVTALRAQLRCPVYLLVVAPADNVAAWASKPIPVGQPGFILHPSVMTFSEVPRIVNATEAQERPELAVLSALAHPEAEIATVALNAINSLSEQEQRLYKDLILERLPTGLRESIEKGQPVNEDVRLRSMLADNPFVRAVYFYEEGKTAGGRQALRDTILGLARTKLASVSAEDEEAVAGLLDSALLTALTMALGKASTEEEARSVFDEAMRRAKLR